MKIKVRWKTEHYGGSLHTFACVGATRCGEVGPFSDEKKLYGWRLLLPTFPYIHAGLLPTHAEACDRLEDMIHWWFELLEKPYSPADTRIEDIRATAKRDAKRLRGRRIPN